MLEPFLPTYQYHRPRCVNRGQGQDSGLQEGKGGGKRRMDAKDANGFGFKGAALSPAFLTCPWGRSTKSAGCCGRCKRRVRRSPSPPPNQRAKAIPSSLGPAARCHLRSPQRARQEAAPSLVLRPPPPVAAAVAAAAVSVLRQATAWLRRRSGAAASASALPPAATLRPRGSECSAPPAPPALTSARPSGVRPQAGGSGCSSTTATPDSPFSHPPASAGPRDQISRRLSCPFKAALALSQKQGKQRPRQASRPSFLPASVSGLP